MLVFEKEGAEYSLEFPNRCFICLAKVSRKNNGTSCDISELNQFPVNKFQQVFNHLLPDNDKVFKFFEPVPPICPTCGTLLELLHNALNQLETATIAVKSRIMGSDVVNREQLLQEFLLDLWNTQTGLRSVQEALDLLEKIGHGPFQDLQTLSSPSSSTEMLHGEPKEVESCGGIRDLLTNDTKPETSQFQNELKLEDASGETDNGIDYDEYPLDDNEMEEEPIPLSSQNLNEVDPLSDYDLGRKNRRNLPKVKHPDTKVVGTSSNSLSQDRRAAQRAPKSRLRRKIVIVAESSESEEYEDEDSDYSPDEDIPEINPAPSFKTKGKFRNCDMCGKCISIGNMLKHVRSHVGDYAIPCPNSSCKLVFSNMSTLNKHSFSHSTCRKYIKERAFTCNACGHQAPHGGLLRIHLKTLHETTVKAFSCPIPGCSESFSMRQSVQCHLHVHNLARQTNVDQSFQACPDCHVRFSTEELQQHLVNAHGTPLNSVIQCKYCPYTFPSRVKLINHMRAHIKDGVLCDLCLAGDTFLHMLQLKKHYLGVHQVNSFEFVCRSCNKPFDAKAAYKRHVQSCQDTKKGPSSGGNSEKTSLPVLQMAYQKCDYCNKKVKGSEIKDHIRGHVGDYALSCLNPVCSMVCASLQRWKQHLYTSPTCATFTTKDVSTCEQCGYQGKSILSLRNHLQNIHETVDKTYTCPVANCSEQFTCRQTVYCHINVHAYVNRRQKLAPPSFQTCPDCDQEIPQDKIREHLEIVHGITGNSIISCKYCPYLFTSRGNLVEHFAVHISSGMLVSCDMCADETKYCLIVGLRNHYWKEHNVTSHNFICELCSKTFNRQESLSNHLELAHSGTNQVNKRRYKCPDCPDTDFSTEMTLKNHQIKFHGADPFKCQICGMLLQSSQDFLKHKREHFGVKKTEQVFKCDLDGCGKTFKCNSSLQKHKTGKDHVSITNSLICPQCGKGFHRREGLKKHEKEFHSTSRDTICEECGETFKCRQYLRTHRRMVHTREKLFQCHFCQQRFGTKIAMQQHVKKHETMGAAFQPRGTFKKPRKRVNPKY